MELKARSWRTQSSSGVEVGLRPWWVDYSFVHVLFDEQLLTEISDLTLQTASWAKPFAALSVLAAAEHREIQL